MTIGFAILLDDRSHNFVRSLQLKLHQELGLSLARQSPHITIKVPFESTDIEPYSAYLDGLAGEIQPFEIELNRFNHFGQRIIYLEVAENEALTQLHYKILADLEDQMGIKPHEFEGPNVKFHASLVGVHSDGEFQSAMEYLKKYSPKFKFQAETLAIFYHLGGDGGWIINRRIPIN